MAGIKYTEDESILALELYITLERKDIRTSNKRIIGLSKFLSENGHFRNVNSVKMKVENFKACDPLYHGTSLSNYGKTDELVWNRFSSTNFTDLADAAEEARKRISEGRTTENSDYYLIEPDIGGTTTIAQRKVRVNQEIFRTRVLTAYDSKCCITGMQYPSMLEACHIIPWKALPEGSPKRLDPCNGLCLNRVHHRAFDDGLITIDEKYRVELSPVLEEKEEEKVLEVFYYPYENKRISISNPHYSPLQDYLDYHRKNVFIESTDKVHS